MSRILKTWTVLPHDRPEEVDDGILAVAGEIPMPLGNFPRRMTVIRLDGGRTAIWSAIAQPEPVMQQIEAMGRPSILIVPNMAHRLDARIWKDRYPDIKVLTPPGSFEAVSEVVPVDATKDIIDDHDVIFHVVAGTEETESALVVRRAGGTTLVTNDLIGHVRRPHGIGASVMARLMGFGVNGPRITRPAKAHIKDPAALAHQLRRWSLMPRLNRIIVSHGDIITDDPRGVLAQIAEGLEPEHANAHHEQAAAAH